MQAELKVDIAINVAAIVKWLVILVALLAT
jgi:hypothetical protein